ncbi:MAG TPA: hypothetical protein VE177_01085 [Candidatus Binatus sp.]|nr:hypothetical protein [Candidatus Binatus sp.]
MTEELVDVSKLRLEQSVRRFRLLVVAEVGIILGLAAMLTEEYRSNAFMRLWVQQNFWPADLLLSGYFVVGVAGVFIGAILASYRGRRSRDKAILDALRRLI